MPSVGCPPDKTPSDTPPSSDEESRSLYKGGKDSDEDVSGSDYAPSSMDNGNGDENPVGSDEETDTEDEIIEIGVKELGVCTCGSSQVLILMIKIYLLVTHTLGCGNCPEISHCTGETGIKGIEEVSQADFSSQSICSRNTSQALLKTVFVSKESPLSQCPPETALPPKAGYRLLRESFLQRHGRV